MNKKVYTVLETFEAPCGLTYVRDDHPTLPYRATSRYLYRSPRYNKWVLIPEGRRSDGATGAWDIDSCAWWVHDELCNTGQWNDTTPLTNLQCSLVIHDILKKEGRTMRCIGWFTATFLLGGGEARKNGMVFARKQRRPDAELT